ncbi:MAG: hypothetical protein ACPG4T_16180, partial [Nannocystaceae bacterium]
PEENGTDTDTDSDTDSDTDGSDTETDTETGSETETSATETDGETEATTDAGETETTAGPGTTGESDSASGGIDDEGCGCATGDAPSSGLGLTAAAMVGAHLLRRAPTQKDPGKPEG